MDRTLYIDNLRSMMILTIVIFHSAMAYTTILPWWFALDNNNNQIFDLLILFFDSFQLPVLFLLAGYFVLPSLKKYGAFNFTVKKIRKLVIPLILLSITYTPLMAYIRYTQHVENPIGYISYFTKYLATISDYGIFYYADIATIMKYADSFWLFHLWFLSVLFVFYIVTVVICIFVIKKKINKNQTINPYTLPFLVAGIITALLVFATNLFFFDWEWIKAGSFFVCQPVRMPVYIGMFILGLYGYRNNWFKNQIPGNPWKWYILSLTLFLFLIACSNKMWIDQDKSNIVLALFYSILRSFVTISWFCFFLNVSKKYLNKTNKVTRFISFHSYELFLLHLPITVSLQLGFTKINLPVGIKFLMVSVLSVILSLILSSLIYKRIQNFIENFSFFESSKENTTAVENI